MLSYAVVRVIVVKVHGELDIGRRRECRDLESSASHVACNGDSSQRGFSRLIAGSSRIFGRETFVSELRVQAAQPIK